MAIALAITLASAVAACSGNGQGLDAAGRPLSEGGAAGGPLLATFESIQAHVFSPICTVCHAGGAAPQGLRLDSTNSYAMLVGVPSSEVPSLLRVDPGHPDQSYVIQKLEGHAAVGARMPFGGPYLDAATIAVIRQWITDGAARAVAARGPFIAIATVPARGDVVLGAPARIVVGFSEELDQTRLAAGALRLERLRPDGVDLVVTTLHVARGAPGTLLVEPSTPLGEGHYRLVAALPVGIAGIDGAALRGDAGDVRLTEFDVVELP